MKEFALLDDVVCDGFPIQGAVLFDEEKNILHFLWIITRDEAKKPASKS